MITSAQNAKLQHLRRLNDERKTREESGAFCLEGVRLFEEAWNAGWMASQVFFSAGLSERGLGLVEQARAAGVQVDEVEGRLLKSALDTENPQGLAGIFALRTLPLPAGLDFVVVADGLRDPGNLGTLLRSSAAAGAQAVFLTPGTVDAFAPKVLRAGMGAHFRLPLRRMNWAELEPALRPLRVLAADADPKTSVPCWELDLRGALALVIGGEAEGVGPEMRARSNALVRIPMPGQAESLNAAVAAGILLFEVVRQRRDTSNGRL
jgi:TrmH family RNA methyltransferase